MIVKKSRILRLGRREKFLDKAKSSRLRQSSFRIAGVEVYA